MTIRNTPLVIKKSVLIFVGSIIALSFVTGVSHGILVTEALLMLYASVFLHELGHLETAHRLGYQAEEIGLTALGGYVKFQDGVADRSAIVISAVGPVTNLLLFGLFSITSLIKYGSVLITRDIDLIIPFALSMNLFLAVMNLLPIYPLDGSKILMHFLKIRLPEKISISLTSLVGIMTSSVGAAILFWGYGSYDAIYFIIGVGVNTIIYFNNKKKLA